MTTPSNEPDLYVTIYSPSLKHRVTLLRALRATLLHHLPKTRAQFHALTPTPLSDHYLTFADHPGTKDGAKYPLILVDAPNKKGGHIEYATGTELPHGPELSELLAKQADSIRQDIKERIFNE